MYIIQFLCLNFLLIFVSHAWADNNCCAPGQAVLAKNNLCWDSITNVTNPIDLKCNNTFRIRKKYYTIDKDQILHLQVSEDFVQSVDKYCVANLTNIKDVLLKNVTEMAFICYDEEEKEILDDRVLGYCMIVSVIFLVPTAIIYTALPELRDVQGKSIINFCTSLAIGQGILSLMKLMEYSDMALCATRGFLVYFFLIVAFFWTNAIAIQVLLNTRRPATLDYSWNEFKWYFLYAWGIPTLLTTCMAIVNFHPGHHQKPGIGLNHCWFFSKTQQWYYMYSVMSLLLAANIVIFIYISIMLWHMTFSSSHQKALKFKFIMSVRLIVLMGLPWVFEMLGSLTGPHIIVSIIDVFNCLQGMLIFLLLVVFRRRVIKLMYKHGWLDCISGFVEKRLAVEDDEENVVEHTDVPTTVIGQQKYFVDRPPKNVELSERQG